MSTCHCGSGKAFELCCQPLISGGMPAPTAEALMRSRYTAFVLGDLDYLQRTSAGEAALRFDRTELARSLPGTEWLGLTITATESGASGDDQGTVTFEVRYRQNGQFHHQGERSEFRRFGGAWRYCRGEVSVRPQEALRVGRNDPCPCGSGKKYKKCHGAG